MSVKPVRFIHIGLGKCGSTYLQTLWNADPGGNFVNLAPLTDTVKKYATMGAEGKLPEVRMNLPHNGKPTVASSEGLSWGFFNNPERQKHLQHIPAAGAKLLAKARMSDTILVMVRDPLDWVRAVHEQSIKEGGYGTAADFVDRQRRMVRDILNLEAVKAAYEAQFKRVVFLSSDELRHEPDAFWARYEEVLDTPRPGEEAFKTVDAMDEASNASVGDRLLELAAMNRALNLISDAYEGLPKLPPHAEQERGTLLPPFKKAKRWIARRLAEHGDDGAVAEIAAALAPQDRDAFSAFQLDDQLIGQIERRFVDVLAQSDVPDNMLDGYRERLKAHAA
jgi:hypothetical protein